MDALTSLYKGGEPRDPNDWIHLVQNTPYLYMRAVKWNGRKWVCCPPPVTGCTYMPR
ncbi:hypothetical protein D917_08601 [Trichinella nativa]|uniref:Uncharacterized protein n=1 Tax=Trichinella nativa TaxID=6335 RepID=A0A1Y3EJ63_9BILA|nr:hypothetical protein D917_08601 [Trichinella nativa]